MIDKNIACCANCAFYIRSKCRVSKKSIVISLADYNACLSFAKKKLEKK